VDELVLTGLEDHLAGGDVEDHATDVDQQRAAAGHGRLDPDAGPRPLAAVDDEVLLQLGGLAIGLSTGATTADVLAQKPLGYNFDLCPGALFVCGRTTPAESTS